MEIFIYILSAFLPPFLGFALGIIGFDPFSSALLMFIFGTKIMYTILWVKLIKHKSDCPKALWRFIIEWIIGVSYILFLISLIGFTETPYELKKSIISELFIPTNLVGKLWIICNLIFAFEHTLLFPWVYIVIGTTMVTMCALYLKKHYKETGKLW